MLISVTVTPKPKKNISLNVMKANLSGAPYQTFWNQSPEFQSHDDWPAEAAPAQKITSTELAIIASQFTKAASSYFI